MENKVKKSSWGGKSIKVKREKSYLNFLMDILIFFQCKTERECVLTSIEMAKALGYKDFNEIIENNETIKAGDKIYVNNKDKSLALFLIGEEPLEKGMRIIGSHVDSPRLDLKQNPLYEDTNLAMMETHYYGGIKKYQWVALPLALHGVVVKKTELK